MSMFGLKDDKLKLFVDFDNFLNLVDSDANVFKRYSYTEGLVRADIQTGTGRYIYTPITAQYQNGAVRFRDPVVQSSSSLWKIQLGVSYEF
jgi:hypothetical protein